MIIAIIVLFVLGSFTLALAALTRFANWMLEIEEYEAWEPTGNTYFDSEGCFYERKN